ncbi:MAG: ORF6N domain-containing protein [Candidatus Delongbacteria bacterium]|nr:ORF6N domain-containing protein [Candidatus Delongbacteria bacterium]
MVKANEITKLDELGIKDKIYSIRGHQVMLDRDLAELYEVEVKYLNRAVKRNINRFPSEFCILLDNREMSNLKCQIGTSSWGGKRKNSLAFTEQGVAMLAGVLKSEIAVKISIQIIKAFVQMRRFINSNAQIFQRLDRVELKQIETDSKFEEVFSALENLEDIPKQGVFFDGQIFDAHKFVSDLFSSVKKSIVIIDNYIDVTILAYLSQLPKNTKVKIVTRSVSNKLKFDIEKFENQYFPVEVIIFKQSHDRFVIIDDKDVYHIGASLKDLGKKWFAFSKMDKSALDILNKIEEIK